MQLSMMNSIYRIKGCDDDGEQYDWVLYASTPKDAVARALCRFSGWNENDRFLRLGLALSIKASCGALGFHLQAVESPETDHTSDLLSSM